MDYNRPTDVDARPARIERSRIARARRRRCEQEQHGQDKREEPNRTRSVTIADIRSAVNGLSAPGSRHGAGSTSGAYFDTISPHGLTAEELAWRIGAEVAVVRTVLRDEHRLGRVRFDPSTGCYRLAVDALDPELLEALTELRLV